MSGERIHSAGVCLSMRTQSEERRQAASAAPIGVGKRELRGLVCARRGKERKGRRAPGAGGEGRKERGGLRISLQDEGIFFAFYIFW